MSFTQAVRSVLSSYAIFSGRALRSEYWWFYLFTLLVSLMTSIIDAVLNTAFNNEIGIVGTITSLALLLPTLAVTARRLHDTGRTGWWMLLPAIPLVATVVVGFAAVFAIAFRCLRGNSSNYRVSQLWLFAMAWDQPRPHFGHVVWRDLLPDYST